jgi:antitoxin HigA-1
MKRKKEYALVKRPDREPTRPGEILREDVLTALDMSVTEAARQLGVSRQNLHRLLAGEIGVTPEMALRLGKFCGNGPGLWLRMQQTHDLWIKEKELAVDLARIPSHRLAAE